LKGRKRGKANPFENRVTGMRRSSKNSSKTIQEKNPSRTWKVKGGAKVEFSRGGIETCNVKGDGFEKKGQIHPGLLEGDEWWSAKPTW